MPKVGFYYFISINSKNNLADSIFQNLNLEVNQIKLFRITSYLNEMKKIRSGLTAKPICPSYQGVNGMVGEFTVEKAVF